MAWLIANIWISLGAAALLGLIFGVAIRGLAGSNKIRRAQVDRDIAKTELLQTKNELDALYTAQRKSREQGGGDAGLSADKAAGVEAKTQELTERNSWLEGRVAALEKDLEGTQPNTGDPVSDDETAALHQEVADLRQQLSDASADRSGPGSEQAASTELDEELARLRWRNRYLEGRLAYFEEGETPEQGDALAPEISETEGQGEPAPAAETAPETELEAEPEIEAEPELEPMESADVPAEAPEQVAVHPSEAVLEELEPMGDPVPAVQPEMVDKPKDGGDDLTAIGGIGPRIAEVLNDLGIWTYDQIADWSAGNASWVEDHLAFEGRVTRENWIAQAQSLRAAATSDA